MAASISFQATDTDTGTVGSGATYTFPLTVAAASGQERLVAVGGMGHNADFSACTIDGQTATRVGSVSNGALDGDVSSFVTFYRAAGTANTSINVVVTKGGFGDAFAGVCALWTLNDAATVTATTNSGTGDPTLNTNTTSGGCVAAALYGFSASSATAAWTGLTDDFDALVFGTHVFSGASSNIATGQTPRSISADITPNPDTSIGSICVSFAPAVALSYLAPDADSALDGWTDQAAGTTNIYQSIDETSFSDADYVISPAISGSTAGLKVRLYEGVTQIAEWTHTGISDTFVDGEQTLSTPEFEAITDFSDLFIELDDNQGSVYRFSLGDPASGVGEPFKIYYRYKKLTA